MGDFEFGDRPLVHGFYPAAPGLGLDKPHKEPKPERTEETIYRDSAIKFLMTEFVAYERPEQLKETPAKQLIDNVMSWVRPADGPTLTESTKLYCDSLVELSRRKVKIDPALVDKIIDNEQKLPLLLAATCDALMRIKCTERSGKIVGYLNERRSVNAHKREILFSTTIGLLARGNFSGAGLVLFELGHPIADTADVTLLRAIFSPGILDSYDTGKKMKTLFEEGKQTETDCLALALLISNCGDKTVYAERPVEISLANSALAAALQDVGLVKQKEPEQDMTVREFVLKHKLEHAAAAIAKADRFTQKIGGGRAEQLDMRERHKMAVRSIDNLMGVRERTRPRHSNPKERNTL